MDSYDNNERSHAYHDKETQTEPMLEQIIVNDIFNDKSMLQKFIDVSPRQNVLTIICYGFCKTDNHFRSFLNY